MGFSSKKLAIIIQISYINICKLKTLKYTYGMQGIVSFFFFWIVFDEIYYLGHIIRPYKNIPI